MRTRSNSHVDTGRLHGVGRRRLGRAAGGLLTLALALLAAGPVRAEITGFRLEHLAEADSGWSLSDRIGKTNADDEHVINVEDCLAYKGHTIEISFALDPPPASGELYSVKLADPGGSCSVNDLEDLSDSCAQVIDKRVTPTSAGNAFEVDLTDIISADCEAGTEKTTTLYVVYLLSDDTYEDQPIDFLVDLERPTAPTAVEAFPGESSIQVSWTDEANTEDGMKYRVYYRAGVPIDAIDKADGSTESATDATSKTVTGLEANQTYYFRVTAVDPNDNESVLSTSEASTTTVPATDFWELYKDSGGGDPGGFCFIATAAYGTPLAAEVDLLRTFRDRWLLTSSLGRGFVTFYYEHSPPLARAVRKNAWLAAAVRVLLVPLLLLAWFLVELGLVGKLAVLLFGWAIVRTFRTVVRRRYATGGPTLRRLPRLAPPDLSEGEGGAC